MDHPRAFPVRVHGLANRPLQPLRPGGRAGYALPRLDRRTGPRAIPPEGAARAARRSGRLPLVLRPVRHARLRSHASAKHTSHRRTADRSLFSVLFHLAVDVALAGAILCVCLACADPHAGQQCSEPADRIAASGHARVEIRRAAAAVNIHGVSARRRRARRRSKPPARSGGLRPRVIRTTRDTRPAA